MFLLNTTSTVILDFRFDANASFLGIRLSSKVTCHLISPPCAVSHPNLRVFCSVRKAARLFSVVATFEGAGGQGRQSLANVPDADFTYCWRSFRCECTTSYFRELISYHTVVFL